MVCNPWCTIGRKPGTIRPAFRNSSTAGFDHLLWLPSMYMKVRTLWFFWFPWRPMVSEEPMIKLYLFWCVILLGQVLTNGDQVKLQRNALSVVEIATGQEDDDDIEDNLFFNGNNLGLFTSCQLIPSLIFVLINLNVCKGPSDFSSLRRGL
jgi:hypothetical protein